MFRILFVLMFLFVSVSKAADSDALSVDRFIPDDVETSFPNDKELFPQESDFEVINYLLMSSESGERQALVTLKNLSAGSRIFKNEQILALFADGRRRTPLTTTQSFEGHETLSVILSFGVSRFPILEVYTKN